jgi:uncharacterized membrane protein
VSGHGEWTDERVDTLLGIVLRAGVLVAAALVALGAVVFLAHQAGHRPDYSAFRGEPPELRSVGGIVRAAWGWRGDGLIQLGLLALIATPIARVGFSLYAFVRERDWTYVVITLIVLVLLTLGLAGVIA